MRKRVVRIMLAAAVAAGALLVVVVGGQAGGSPPTPSIDWSPSTSGGFDFGLVAVGKTASQTFTLTNSGGSASAALTVTLSGPPTVTITDDTCTATSLGPGKSCTVTVQYAPTTSGPSGVVTLEATGKKAAADATVSIAGHSALVFVASGPVVPGLSPLNENPAHPESSATGTAQVIWDTSTHMMTVNVTFAGLTTPNTAAHIHCCVASPGTTGVATTVPTFTGFPSGVTHVRHDQPDQLQPCLRHSSWWHGDRGRSRPARRNASRTDISEHPHNDVPGRRRARLPAVLRHPRNRSAERSSAATELLSSSPWRLLPVSVPPGACWPSRSAMLAAVGPDVGDRERADRSRPAPDRASPY